MKTLLAKTSPLYLRRLTRELNALPDGFYCHGIRFSSARMRKGELQGYRPGTFLDSQDPRKINPWRGLDTSRELSDTYGRTVTASRTP